MIQVTGLTHCYGPTTVLDNVSVELPKNQLTALVGPNGAGKSTLLNIMGRLLTPTSGSVSVGGLDIKNAPSKDFAKTVAVLQQEQRISSRLSVVELVRFGRFPHCEGRLRAEDHKKVNEALSTMNIESFRDRFLDQLSGGQRQRAYIAMVLAQDTDYVLLDEPLNNLDMRHSLSMMRCLTKMVQELGKTVIVVLHDVNFAAAHADHVVALRDGCIAADSDTARFMCAEVLEDVYGVDVTVLQAPTQKVAVYYR